MPEGLSFPIEWGPCPPDDAEPGAGTVYRITRTSELTADDFRSFAELGRKPPSQPDQLCRSRGLSVYRSVIDARHHLKAFPAGGGCIAEGELTEDHGRTKPTPALDRSTHTTWWCFTGIERHEGFKVIGGREDVDG
jgi:hypothetical protein